MKRCKRNTPEIKPPEPKHIESIHNKSGLISEKELENMNPINVKLFRKMRKDFVYEINFPENSKLKQINQNEFNMLSLYSITLPPSLAIIFPKSFKGCYYLNTIKFIKENSYKNMLEIYDEAFRDTKIESIIIPDNIKKIGSFCFPKCLAKIEFDNGAPKLERIGHSAFRETQIETFKFPNSIEIFVQANSIFYHCKKLKTIIFDSYINKDDEISLKTDLENYEKDRRAKRKEKFNEVIQKLRDPSEKVGGIQYDEEIDRSQDFAKSYLLSQTKIEKLEVYVSNMNFFYFFNTPNLNTITVFQGESRGYSKIKGCLYTRDKKKLIVAERKVKSTVINSQCQIIANYAFNIKRLEKVSFEEDSELKEISFLAFYESSIKNIDVPDSVDLIDYAAFYNCAKLEEFKIPNSMNSIDFYTFAFTNLTKICIPKNIVRIGYASFLHCSNLTSVTFEKRSKLVEIDDFAFASTKIKSISIPKNVRRIGNYCFSNCTDLKSIEFDENSKISEIGLFCFNLTKIDESQLVQIYQKIGYFYSNSKSDIYLLKSFYVDKITQVCLPSSLESIECNSFRNCVNLKKVEITDISNSKLTKISKCAFTNCNSLTEFEIPKTVNYFGSYSFQNCVNFEVKINVDVYLLTVCRSAFENCGLISFHSKSKQIQVCNFAFKNCSNLIRFKADVTNECVFNNFVFFNCSSLKYVSISHDVFEFKLGKGCFMNSSIQKFNVPDNLVVISKYSFENCKKLGEVEISENSIIREFKNEAFSFSGIKKIFIPSTTKLVEKTCFLKCEKLTEITFSNGMSRGAIANTMFENLSSLKKCPLLFKREINDYQFKNTAIESITFPSSLKRIHKFAFADCIKLKSISFRGFVEIDSFAFAGCKNLENIKTNKSIRLILAFSDIKNDNYIYATLDQDQINQAAINSFFTNEKPAFKASKILKCTDVMIYSDECEFNSNINIYINAFQYKYKKVLVRKPLKAIEFVKGGYYSNQQKIFFCADFSTESITILKETRFISSNAFCFSNLKKINFEKGCLLKEIRSSAFKFQQISEISIPDTVKVIGESAFSKCLSLKKVNISKNSQLNKIESFAFERCPIKTILFPSTLENIDSFAFYECFELTTVDNHSNKIYFGEKSFFCTSIKDFKFPSKSYFGVASFKQCSKLKELLFLEKPKDVQFEYESFAMSGLESFKFEDDTRVQLEYKAFDLCNLNQETKNIILKLDEFYFDYWCRYVHSYDDYLIDNVSIFQKGTSKKIKDNEILKVPSYVEELWITMSHIKEIQWHENCIVNDLGGPNCFSYFNLIKITIPKNVDQIPSGSFKHCYYLKTVQFEEGSNLTQIGEYSFSNSSVEKVILPDSVQIIKKYAFSFNNNLKEVTFNGEIIENDAFLQTGIIEFNLSNNTKSIGASAFQYCHCLKKFSIDINKSKLEEIGPYAFAETSIEKINIPSKIKVIKKFVFNGCEHLKTVKISSKSNLESIEEYSFSGDLILEKINIPKSITKLSYKAFINTPSLLSIMDESNDYFSVKKNNSIYYKDQSLIFVPRDLESYKISKNCPVIHSGAFCGPNLEKVSFLDNSLIRIGNSAFAQSTRLKNIKIPNSIKKIESHAFVGCQNLEVVEFDPDCKIKTIPSYCFAFSGLKKIVLPKSVEIIDNFSFYLCQNIQEIDLQNIKYIGNSAFSGTSIEKIKFSPKIEFIENHAFEIKSIKMVDFKSCGNNIKDWYPLIKINNVRDFINQSKKYKKNHFSSNTCFVQESSFYGSSVQTFNFDLKYHKWFNFFDKCSKIEKYILNANIQYTLEKLPKENLDYYSIGSTYIKKNQDYYYYYPRKFLYERSLSIRKQIYDHKIGGFYKFKEIKCKNECKILWFKEESNVLVHLSLFRLFNSSNLTKITLTDDISIKCIPNNCFINASLEEITIPKSVSKIEQSAFRHCYSLQKVIFSKNSKLKKIKKFAFLDCKKLKTISIPKLVDTISCKCFASSGLEEIKLNSKIVKIESFAFCHCESLKTVVLNEGIIELGDCSFAFCKSISTIDLPDSLQTIKPYAFSHCIKLRKVNSTSKSNLVEIGEGAFEFTSIKKLKLNPKIQKLFVPRNMPKLEEISFFEGKVLNFEQSKDGILYKIVNKSDFTFYDEYEDLNMEQLYEMVDKINCDDLLKINDVKKIVSSMIMKRKKLFKLLYVPNNIDSLKFRCSFLFAGDFSFERIKKSSDLINKEQNKYYFVSDDSTPIKNLKFLSELIVLPKGIFSYFNSLQTVDFGKETKLFYIPKNAFSNCTNLQGIVIPTTCIFIEDEAFKDCISLKSINFGRLDNSDEKNHKLLSIGNKAFYNCSSLRKIVLPPSLVRIESSAFMNCSKLKSVEFGTKFLSDENKALISIEKEKEKLQYIGKNAFNNCTSLVSFRIPKNCSYVGESAFMNCTSLNKVSFKCTKLKEFNDRIFCNCSSLETIRVVGLFYEDKSENKPFVIKYEAFLNCTSLKNVTFEDNSKDIDTLNKNTVPGKNKIISSIRKRAFCNCSSLTKARFIIGDLKSIDGNAFLNCSSLQTIEINSQFYKEIINRNLVSNAFVGCPKKLKIDLINKNEKVQTINNVTPMKIFKK